MSTPATFDLHLHSYWSHDASAAPESHLRRARELGVGWIALTEHYHLDSLAELLEAAAGYPEVTPIPSTELTVDTSIGEVDLLCYGFPLSQPPELRELLDTYREWRIETGRAVVRGLRELGCDIDENGFKDLARTYRPSDVVDRHGLTQVKGDALRRYLLETGRIAGDSEFPGFRARAKELGAAPPYPTAAEVVPAVRRLGAVVSIAHPHDNFGQGDPGRMDALREEIGFDGIECAHPMVPPEFTPFYRAYCVEHGLVSTGGSDSHTEADIAAGFAGHAGADEWMEELLERLPAAPK